MHTVMRTGSDVLDKIMAHKQDEVAARAANFKLSELKRLAADTPSCLSFEAALSTHLANGQSAVIAEIKKASPSKGIIREHFVPSEIAQSYALGGAACLSVLTDEEFFKGHTDYLKQARQACTLPILRKDFICDEYQIYEAKAMQADCILLIVAALNDGLLHDLAGRAMELGLDVLVEVHDRIELERALKLDLPVIGINNRNLRDFSTSLNVTIDLLPLIPDEVLVITESGIHTSDDVALMRSNNVNTFLIGEAFMRAAEPGQKLRELFS